MYVTYGVTVSKTYEDLGYDELVKVLKEVEGCWYGVTVDVYRDTDEMDEFTGKYSVVVKSEIGGLDPDKIEHGAKRMYDNIDHMTKVKSEKE